MPILGSDEHCGFDIDRWLATVAFALGCELAPDSFQKISQQIALVSTLKDEDGINLDFSAICKK